MSQEREVNTPSGATKTFNHDDLNKLSDKQLDAHVAAVLDRGMTNARLQVALPDDLVGEWVPNDSQSVYEKQLLGFTVDETYALRNALNNDGSGKSIVGDCIHMVAPKRLMQAVEKKRALDFQARHGANAGKKRKNQVEEDGFLAQDHGGLHITNDSQQNTVDMNAITAAKDAANADAINAETQTP